MGYTPSTVDRVVRKKCTCWLITTRAWVRLPPTDIFMDSCKHNKYEKCPFCKANDHAAYELTGTTDPKKQKEYWDRVWNEVKKLRGDKVML